MLIFYPFKLSVSNTGRNTCRAGKYGVYFSGKAGEPLLENRFGFIREKIDIKILILYVLSRCRFPADNDQLSEMVMCDDGVSYFDYAECLDELIGSGHVECTDGRYLITEKGRSNGIVTESSVPFSVRKKATLLTIQFNSAEARRRLRPSFQSFRRCCADHRRKDVRRRQETGGYAHFRFPQKGRGRIQCLCADPSSVIRANEKPFCLMAKGFFCGGDTQI